MNSVEWSKITELFEAALARPLDQRALFLEGACGGDRSILRRVEEMLAADAQEDLLMDRPAYQASTVLASTLNLNDVAQSFDGDVIGDYRLIKELGRGGMGTVYLAQDTRLGRQAALKLLPFRFNSPERVRRLQREAHAASTLNHPHIITIYDFGLQNDRYFIASEFVEGRTLRHFVGKPDLTLNQILEITIQVASALETAHTAGIIHRDIKPENISCGRTAMPRWSTSIGKADPRESQRAETKPIDLKMTGLETRTGVPLGTVNYMSPEQDAVRSWMVAAIFQPGSGPLRTGYRATPFSWRDMASHHGGHHRFRASPNCRPCAKRACGFTADH
jgi:predicted Ser/Thr protein kinase